MRKFVLTLLLGVSVLPVSAQVQTGLYPYGSFDNPGPDTIDRGSLNVHLSLPVVTKTGRGIPFQYQLVYDSLVWTPVGAVGSQVWTPAVGFGLHGQLNEGFQGYLSYNTSDPKCYSGSSFTYEPINSNYVYHDQFDISHPFKYKANYCTDSFTGTGPATDGSGYSFDGSIVTSADGKQINAPVNNQASSGTITDTNGNYINNNGNGTFTDTLGKTALTITGNGTAASPKKFTYATLNGTATATVAYQTYTVQTVFGCSNVTEYNLSQDLVHTITLGDGSVYQFNYETTPSHSPNVTGRLASITLPQGGVITYQYTGTNNGIVCADGTPTGLSRLTTNGNRTYVRSLITATSSHTDLVDGLADDSGFDFEMAGSPEAFYETNRTVHQGNSSGPVLLTRQTCYDGTSAPCTTTTIGLPISQIDTYETLNGLQQHGSTLKYNTYGLLTSKTDYDFGGPSSRGGILRGETWAYPSTGIVDLVSSDTVNDGNTEIALTTYFYDQTAVMTSSGLPNHSATSSQRGNLTTVNQYFDPNNYLSSTGVYEDTGDTLSTTGPAGTSTYTPDAATHAFITKATPPALTGGLKLPSQATWDANSGLAMTAVDPNNQTTTYKSYDPLGRRNCGFL